LAGGGGDPDFELSTVLGPIGHLDLEGDGLAARRDLRGRGPTEFERLVDGRDRSDPAGRREENREDSGGRTFHEAVPSGGARRGGRWNRASGNVPDLILPVERVARIGCQNKEGSRHGSSSRPGCPPSYHL